MKPITENDIVSRCPVSKRPFYVIFYRGSYKETGEPYWSALTRANDRSEALFKANLSLPYSGPEHDRFILETTFSEAVNMVESGVHYTDAEFAKIRNPYPVAAE